MEMNLRDGLVILGVLVVVGVLVDGLRRMWLARRRANELNFGLEDVQVKTEEYGSELPNGGARLLDDELEEQAYQAEQLRTPPVQRKEPFLADEHQKVDSTVAENVAAPRAVSAASDNGSVSKKPVKRALAEELKAEAETTVSSAKVVEKQPARKRVSAEPVDQKNNVQKKVMEPPLVLPGQQALALDEPVPVLMDMDETAESFIAAEHTVKVDADEVRIRKRRSVRAPVRTESSEIEATVVTERDIPLDEEPVFEDHLLNTEPKEEVLVINVMAREDRPFSGDKLLAFFQEEGIRFGDMNIFHRHVQEDGTGQILFSVANGVEPGTFNLRTMDNSYTKALSFFLGLPGPAEPHQAFRIMVECVHNLSRDLGGVLKDEQHSVLTGQTLEHYRERICEYERRHLVPRKTSSVRV